MGRGLLRRAAAVVAGLALPDLARGFTYSFTTDIGGGTGATDVPRAWSEGPMYGSNLSPFTGDSHIDITYQATMASSPALDPSSTVAIHLVVLNDFNTYAVGYTPLSGQGLRFCCPAVPSPDIPNCPVTSESVGGDFAYNRTAEFVIFTQRLDSQNLVADGSFSYNISVSGDQQVLVVACLSGAAVMPTSPIPSIITELKISFRNPYGYIPGHLYGLLPTYGILFVGYLILLIVYGVQLLCQRQYSLKLQYLVLGVVALGVVETTTWFIVYESKNRTGIPTPCTDLCPTTNDFVFATVLTVAKRASSRALLLAVALGFGVVHPVLDRRSSWLVAGLSAAYFTFGVLDALARKTSYDVGPTFWEFPVIVLDASFILLIYNGMLKLRTELTASGQQAKLRMYSQLMNVILGNMVAWTVFVIMFISIEMEQLPFPWRWVFILLVFWDVIYFTVLCAVSYIWRPGPEAFQYAYSMQVAVTEGEGGEMGGAPSPHMEDSGGIPAPGSFTIEEEEEGEGNNVRSSAAVAPSAPTEESRKGGASADHGEVVTLSGGAAAETASRQQQRVAYAPRGTQGSGDEGEGAGRSSQPLSQLGYADV